VIVVEIPGRGEVWWDGPDDVTVTLAPEIEVGLLDAGARGLRRLRELQNRLQADVDRVLHQPAYRPDAFEGSGEWRVLPGTAAHVRLALLGLARDASIMLDDEDEIMQTLRDAAREP